MSRRSRSPAQVDFSDSSSYGSASPSKNRPLPTLSSSPSKLLPLAKYYYVYILETEDGEHHYVGFTEDLRKRIDDHLSGRSPHTSKYGPWRLKTYVAFSDHSAAIAFEKYLKSGSGRAFAKKRF